MELNDVLSEMNILICYMPKTELRMQSYDMMNMARIVRVSGKESTRSIPRSRSHLGWLLSRNPSSYAPIHCIVSPHPYLRFWHIAYQNVHLRESIISFHCIIFIWAHLDARNAVRRGLLEIIVRSATPFRFLSFLPWLMCAWYAREFFRCFVKGFCHLSRGVTHIFLGCVWWLVQASKVVHLLILFLGT